MQQASNESERSVKQFDPKITKERRDETKGDVFDNLWISTAQLVRNSYSEITNAPLQCLKDVPAKNSQH